MTGFNTKTPRAILLLMLLFMSLIGNLWLGGMVAGSQTAHKQFRELGMLAPLVKLTQELPPEQGGAAHAILDPVKTELVAANESLRTQRAHIRELMLAEPVDAAALKQAFASYNAAFDRYQLRIQELMLKAAQTLPLDQRSKLMEDRHR